MESLTLDLERPSHALLLFAAIYCGGVCPAIYLLGPARRFAPTLLALVPAVLFFPIFWAAPGPVAILTGMFAAAIFLRALDARLSYEGDSRLGYLLYINWLVTHPSEDREPAPARERVKRLARGVTLVGLTIGLLLLSGQLQLWTSWPYLDTVLVTVEVGLLLIGAVDLMTVAAWTVRLKWHWVDGVDPGCFWAPSLRAFWGRAWSRPVAGALRRGIFVPVGGRRAMARGVFVVFLACGLMHAAPLVLGGPNRAAWAWIASGSLAFFMLHGAVLMLEASLPRLTRRGPLGRVILYGTFLATAPLYPAAMIIAIGGHGGRPLESYILLRIFGG